jgi:group I intron endonuclease
MEVYFDLNKTNGKAYVGWTKGTAAKRFKRHCVESRIGSNLYFHNAIRKYGPDAFDVITVYKGDDAEEMKQVEKNYIAGMRTNDKRFGYNLTAGGDGALGYVCSEEAREKLRVAGRRTGKTNHPQFGQWALESGHLARIQSAGSHASGLKTANLDNSLEHQKAASHIGLHTYWHVRRGIIKEGCDLCTKV